MKTLQDLYTEITNSDELKKAFVDAVKANNVMDFLKEQGCDATSEELEEFLEEKAEDDSSFELSIEQLKDVAGGSLFSITCNYTTECVSDTCMRDCC